jgi:hypothetical protein
MTAAQRYSPLALQGRVSAAVSMAITGPQTVSIAVGTVLVDIVDYRVLLIAMAILTGGCAFVLLAERPGAECTLMYTEYRASADDQ